MKQCKRCREIFRNIYSGGLCFGCTTELTNNNELDRWIRTHKAHQELVAEYFTPEDPTEKRRRVALQWVTLGMAAMQSPQVIRDQLATEGMPYKNLPMSNAYKSLGDEISDAYKSVTTPLKPPTDEIRAAMKWVNMSRTRARNGNNKKVARSIPRAVHVVIEGEL